MALAALSSAFVIPQDKTADGVYSVEVRDDGTKIITRLEIRNSVLETSPNRAAQLFPRGMNGQVWCGCGFKMDPKNCDDAFSDMRRQLANGDILGGQSFYAIKTNVVAFACNRDPRARGLSPDTFSNSLGDITDRCGRFIAGAQQRGPNKNSEEMIVGYQRWSPGTDFCRGATTSPASSC